MQSVPGPLRPGARVGRFVVREEIGCGATSVVYEAEHRTVRHRVAIKVMRPGAAGDRELRQRFEREMGLCASIASMHLPHVYEVGELPSGLPFIVMERLEGASLADWIACHRRLPIPVVTEIGIQLCSALASLHQHQVVHRDIKPENLLLHRAFQGGYVVKLLDLGIGKPLGSDGPTITRAGTAVGTPGYMSPEQVQGLPLDPRTDLYAAGVVLYELATGHVPFEGDDLDALARAILFGHPPRPTSLRPEIPAVLEGLVLGAMARERGDRPPSALALRRSLEHFADEEGLRRHPEVWGLLPARGVPRVPPPPPPGAEEERPGVPTPVRLPTRRSGVTAGAIAGLTVLAAAGASVFFLVEEAEPALAPDPPAEEWLEPEGAPETPTLEPRAAVPVPFVEPPHAATTALDPPAEPALAEAPPLGAPEAEPDSPPPSASPSHGSSSRRARAAREERATRRSREPVVPGSLTFEPHEAAPHEAAPLEPPPPGAAPPHELPDNPY